MRNRIVEQLEQGQRLPCYSLGVTWYNLFSGNFRAQEKWPKTKLRHAFANLESQKQVPPYNTLLVDYTYPLTGRTAYVVDYFLHRKGGARNKKWCMASEKNLVETFPPV